MENKWRALRYGVEGKLIDFGKKIEVPFKDLMLEYLDFVDDVVDELGSRRELEYIKTMLEVGSGADRQLKVYRETGDLKKVVDYIVAETALPPGSPVGSTSLPTTGHDNPNAWPDITSHAAVKTSTAEGGVTA